MFVSSFLSLRQRFIAEWSITTAAEAMLVDLAVLNYYHGLRVQGWIGDSALHLEHQFFGQDAFATNGQKRGSARGGHRASDDLVRRLGEQLFSPALVPWFDLDQHRFWVGAPAPGEPDTPQPARHHEQRRTE